jgi:hypothetical protein
MQPAQQGIRSQLLVCGGLLNSAPYAAVAEFTAVRQIWNRRQFGSGERLRRYDTKLKILYHPVTHDLFETRENVRFQGQ